MKKIEIEKIRFRFNGDSLQHEGCENYWWGLYNQLIKPPPGAHFISIPDKNGAFRYRYDFEWNEFYIDYYKAGAWHESLEQLNGYVVRCRYPKLIDALRDGPIQFYLEEV